MTRDEWREWNRCKVCHEVPDDEGCLQHGRDCSVISEAGGGLSWFDLTPEMEAELAAREAEDEDSA